MTPHDSKHLTADELDASLAGNSSRLVASHLATCPMCAAMVESDGRLVAALATLRPFDVTAGFSDRVMARVAVAPAASVAPIQVDTERSVAARRRALAATLLAVAGVAAGFTWATVHPAAALRWSGPAVQSAGDALWLSLQTLVANATGQPWFSAVRDTMATPARALLTVVGFAGIYAIGLTGLRRVMTEPATNAGW